MSEVDEIDLEDVWDSMKVDEAGLAENLIMSMVAEKKYGSSKPNEVVRRKRVLEEWEKDNE